MARRKRDLAKGFQLSNRPGDAGYAIVDVELDDLLRRPLAAVGEVADT